MRLSRAFSTSCVAVLLSFAAPKTDWQGGRKKIETILHISRPFPNVEAKTYGKFSPAPDVAADRVSFATDYQLRVPAVVYHQAAATITKHPAMILVNDRDGDKSSWYDYWAGILYSRSGAIVLTYDPIGEYERNKERRSQTELFMQNLEPGDLARRLAGLMITDVLEAANYLVQRPDVDSKRIAVIGYGVGSLVAVISCALESPIRVCVFTGGADLDELDGFWDRQSKDRYQSSVYRSLAPLGDRAAVLFALNAKRGPTLVWNGSDDETVDAQHHGRAFFENLRVRTSAEAGGGKYVFDFGFSGGGHLPYFVTRPVASWLDDKLKLPNWTKKDVDALPDIRVGDWADKNHVAVQQGTTAALGNDIPAVSRSELHAIPEAVWDAEQNAYIYETWLERATAAVRSGAQ